MGLVTKKLRQKGREEFVAPRYLLCSHEPAQAFSIVEQTLTDMNAAKDVDLASRRNLSSLLDKATGVGTAPYHFYSKRQGDKQLLLSYARSVESMTSGKLKARTVGTYWLAALQCDGPDSANPEQQRYRIWLQRWLVHDDGKIRSADIYDTLVEHIQGALQAQPVAKS